jgi:hypothetical protein
LGRGVCVSGSVFLVFLIFRHKELVILEFFDAEDNRPFAGVLLNVFYGHLSVLYPVRHIILDDLHHLLAQAFFFQTIDIGMPLIEGFCLLNIKLCLKPVNLDARVIDFFQ